MSGLKISLFLVFCFAFGSSPTGLSCPELCKVKRTEPCEVPKELARGLSTSALPCAICNTTGQTDGNKLMCLPDTLKMLQLAGHSDSNRELKPLPGLAQLHTLILWPGRLLTVGQDILSALPNVTTLALGRNAISAIGSWFGGISKLRSLYLSWNEVEEIKENAFQPLIWLESLYLSHNRIRAIEEWHFADLTNLVYLYLDNNSISRIAGKCFGHLSSLIVLNLAHNKLLSLNAEWLKGLTALRNANFRHNLISAIPGDQLTAMGERLRFINIEENPLRCTCALKSLKSVRARALLGEDTYRGLRCSYPPSVSGRRVAEVEEMICPMPTARVSRRDDGHTLICEVFWEKQPENIRCLDPTETLVGKGKCGGAVNARLEHEFPITEFSGRGMAHSALPYIGRSTCTISMSHQVYRCWKGGVFRCIVQQTKWSSTWDLDVNLTLNVSNEARGEGQMQEPIVTTVYTTAPSQYQLPQTHTYITDSSVLSKPEGPETTQEEIPAPLPRTHTYVNSRVSSQSRGTETTQAEEMLEPTVTTVYTTAPAQWHTNVTEGMRNSTDMNPQQKRTTPEDDTKESTVMIAVYTTSACLALVFLGLVMVACFKCYERHHLHNNTDGAIGGGTLQHNLPPVSATSTNPIPLQQDIHEEIQNDDDSSPAAPIPPPRPDSTFNVRLSHCPPGRETTQADEISDSRQGTQMHVNSVVSPRPQDSEMQGMMSPSGASSDPQGLENDDEEEVDSSNTYLDLNGQSRVTGLETPQVEKIPAPLPPQQDPETTQAEEIPAPLPRIHTYRNSNVLLQQQGPETTQTEEIPAPLPRIHTYVNTSVLLQQQDPETTQTEEIPAPLPRTHTYVNSSVLSQKQGPGSTQEEIPAPLPRIHTYVNTSVLIQQQDPETTQTEEILDPLSRTHTYVNSSVLSQKQGPGTTQEEIPAPLPRIHTYVNTSVLLQQQGPETTQTEEILDPLSRIHTYVNSNFSSQPQGREIHQEEIPAPLPRTHTYVNTSVLLQQQDPETTQTEEIAAPLPRTHTYVDSNIQPLAHVSTTGNPTPLQHGPEEVWGEDDTSIATYDKMTRLLENPVFIADVTEPKGATFNPDPCPRSNPGASLQPDITRVGEVPDSPSRSNNSVNISGSYYPPIPETIKAEEIPEPLPQIHTYVNSNVSSQPQGLEMTQAEWIPDPIPHVCLL